MPNLLKAVGQLPDLGDSEVAGDLTRAFATLHERATELKMFAAHYPRAELPGRCIGIVVTLHDLPDPMVEDDVIAAEQFARSLHENFEADGMLLEVRQIWQLDGDRPRLIEATIELTDQFDRIMSRVPPSGYFGDPGIERITFDKTRGGHFGPFGGGARRGLLWVDRSCGIGEPDSWSATYRMRPARTPESPLPPAVVKALKDFVTRF